MLNKQEDALGALPGLWTIKRPKLGLKKGIADSLDTIAVNRGRALGQSDAAHKKRDFTRRLCEMSREIGDKAGDRRYP